MSTQLLLADLRNTRTLLEAEQERRQRAEAEVDRLRGIEDKALAQSEYIQTHGLTEYEQARLQAEVDRLRADNKRLTADLENARNASDFWTWLHTGEAP
jgi:hypothetical protein